jgi:hypothetical protein
MTEVYSLAATVAVVPKGDNNIYLQPDQLRRRQLVWQLALGATMSVLGHKRTYLDLSQCPLLPPGGGHAISVDLN